MLTVLAFIVALALLIAVHEYGHYRMARACGVKVVRFSIGFGRVLWRRRSGDGETEFTICAFPLGGYVRMLDETEAPVAPGERARAFNLQPLRSRVLIVAAGPLANLLLAVLLYAVLNWVGVEQPRAVLASPEAGTLAARAGVTGGERVEQASLDGDEAEPIQTMEELRWVLTRGALEGRAARLQLADGRSIVLALEQLEVDDDAQLLHRIGVAAPYTQARIGPLMAGGAAERAGLRPGDLVLQVDGRRVVDGRALRAGIRAAIEVDGGQARGWPMRWRIARDGQELDVEVVPDAVREGEEWVGRIGAYVGAAPELVTVHYGPLEGLWLAGVRTWETSWLSLRMIGRMVTGDASLKNLSGPLTIADYAGRSARLGLLQYLTFLALISVSLGVLNLLPLPMLDGGHLMYYLWEGMTGRPLSAAWLERLQRGGLAVLVFVMALALFNDLARLLG